MVVSHPENAGNPLKEKQWSYILRPLSSLAVLFSIVLSVAQKNTAVSHLICTYKCMHSWGGAHVCDTNVYVFVCTRMCAPMCKLKVHG